MENPADLTIGGCLVCGRLPIGYHLSGSQRERAGPGRHCMTRERKSQPRKARSAPERGGAMVKLPRRLIMEPFRQLSRIYSRRQSQYV